MLLIKIEQKDSIKVGTKKAIQEQPTVDVADRQKHYRA